MTGRYTIVTISIDSDLLHEAEGVFALHGLTVERAVLMFFHWCAEHPEEAKWALRRWRERG